MITINPLTGVGDKDVSISSTKNEGIDTIKNYAASASDVRKQFAVRQIGMREKFQDSGSSDFLLSNNTSFNVLKPEYAV